MDRFALIARKHEVRRRLEQTQRQLDELRDAAGPKQDRRRIAQLEDTVTQLMAEEHNLRLAIDRAKPQP